MPSLEEDLRSIVKGRLLTALQEEVRSWEHAETQRSSPTKAARRASGTRRVTLEVVRVDLVQLSGIDLRQQKFTAQLFVQFRFENGALDEALADPNDAFPVDAAGKPTFRPSARWFLKQIDLVDATIINDMMSSQRGSNRDLPLAAAAGC